MCIRTYAMFTTVKTVASDIGATLLSPDLIFLTCQCALGSSTWYLVLVAVWCLHYSCGVPTSLLGHLGLCLAFSDLCFQSFLWTGLSMPTRSAEGIHVFFPLLLIIKSPIMFLLSLSWFALMQAAAIITLLFITAINLAIGILPHADNFAHIGGFASGFLLGFVLLARPQFGWMERHELPQTNQPPKYKPYQYVLWFVALVVLIVG